MSSSTGREGAHAGAGAGAPSAAASVAVAAGTAHVPAAITLGTSGLGGVRQSYGAAAGLAAALLRSAFSSIDTSNAYADGASERMLGAAVRSHGGLPPTIAIYSKADADPETRVLDGVRVRRSFEETVERLGVDYIPIYHLHDPYSITVSQAFARGGAVEALVALRDEGLVGAIGIAAGPLALMSEYVATGAFDAMLTHNRYTLADRTAADLIHSAKALGMTVFNAAPFGGGILAGSDAKRASYAYRPASPELLAWIDAVRALCADAGVPIAAVALNFSTSHPLIDSTVVGISSTDRLSQLAELASTPVPSALRDAVAALGDPPATTTDELSPAHSHSHSHSHSTATD